MTTKTWVQSSKTASREPEESLTRPPSATTLVQPMTTPPHITILGGGPAGLAAGAAARDHGLEAMVLEAQDRVGGNCQTLEVDGFRFDSGAHRVHDKDPEITAWLAGRLGDELHEVAAPSRIWDEGRWLGFPITGGELLRHMGFGSSLAAGADLAYRRLTRFGPPENFRDFALTAYGRPVARRFLLNYSEKLWGAPCDRLSTEIAGKRLAGLDLRTFISESLIRRKGRSRHVEGRFLYPRGGIKAVPAVLAEDCGHDRIRTGTQVEGMEHDSHRITAVRVAGGERISVDEVVSSLPLSVVIKTLEPAPPASVKAAVDRLRFRQVVLVALFIDRPSLTDAATIYFPDRRFEFTRICEPRNRCPSMAPEGRTSLVAEIPCFTDDPIWRASEEETMTTVCRRLAETGLFGEDEVVGGSVYRLHNAYPVLETGLDDALAEIGRYLTRFDNLRTVGRGGTFSYGWIHNMIRDGRNSVAEIAEKS